MTTQKPPGQIPGETFYEKLLSLVGAQDQIQKLKNSYPESGLSKQDQGHIIRFCKDISTEWVVKTLSNNRTANEKKMRFISLAIEEKTRFISLKGICQDERDAEIYFYFLFFSGILFLFTKEEFKHGLYGLRDFFEEEKKKNNRSLLFNFITTYIDLVDPNVRDIDEYTSLKKCLKGDEYNILFNLFDEGFKFMMEILQKTPDWSGDRCNIIKQQIFPAIEDKEKCVMDGVDKNVISSIIQSGIAKLYFIAGAGRELDHIDRLKEALSSKEGVPYNSFALNQTAHIIAQLRGKLDEALDEVLDDVLDKNKESDEEENYDKILRKRLHELIKIADSEVKVKVSRKDPVSTSKRLFERVKVRIEKDEQFKGFDPLNYRILFEAVIGLAYIDFLRGHDDDAEQKYDEAEKIINKHLRDENRKYLRSILLLNRGRNRLDNGSKKDDEGARNDFKEVIEIYEKGPPTKIKNELAEIAARAYNNLGIYYLNEADYDQAEKCFRQSMEMDYGSPYARYNLGVLYYKQEDKTRALALFKNAHYIDPGFSEATIALDKVGGLKKSNLGSDWYSWWFEKGKQEKGTKRRMSHKRVSKWRPIIAVAALLTIALAFGRLAIDIHLHDLQQIPELNSTISRMAHQHDPNPYLLMIGVGIVILLLPFINKLKISDIEMELETAGYRPVAPASVTEGAGDSYYDALKNKLFFGPFWYPFDTSNTQPLKDT